MNHNETTIEQYHSFKIASRLSWLYFCVAFPAAWFIPEWVSWENGPLEMAQNIVLFSGIILSLYFFCSSKKLPKRLHYLWLAVAGYFLILLGRELSWGRVFFPRHITEHGPTFIAMHEVPHYLLILGGITTIILIILITLTFLIPWKQIFLEIPFPKSAFILLVFAIIFATLGDKGVITGTIIDQTIEEMLELLVYFLNEYFLCWYHDGIANH
ncbi:MAG: hypothetical protein U0M19_01260 [Caecibacter sp.]|jgi:hypothetical protein|nr:hypothetical protein [Megasphaera sp.]MEE0721237.1 hypothetical protein [Caecibacter sp.]